MGFRWYVIRVRSGNEKKAVKSIIENAVKNKIANYFKEFIIPVENISQVRRGKVVNVEKRLYPGYIIANISKIDFVCSVIKNSQYVNALMYSYITDEELMRVRKSVEEGKVIKEIKNTFEVGESVRIVDGPFETFSGSIEEMNKEGDIVKVIVNIFGRETPVDLNHKQIEKISMNN